MAEVIGVLSTVFTLFQQCQAAFTLFTTARSFGEDGDTIRCMLEWEEYRFARWGEASGLPSWNQVDRQSELYNGSSTGSKALNWALISNTLRVLHNLLQDSEKLKRKYRLNILDDDSKFAGNDYKTSSTRIRKLFRLPERTLAAAETDRPTVGLIKKISWALEDKDQVQKLVTDISGLNNHLMALLDVAWQMSIQKNLVRLLAEAETRVETAEDQMVVRKAMDGLSQDQEGNVEERRRKLFSAIFQGNLDEVELLFASGASHKYRWSSYTSPLGVAVEAKQLAIAKFLLENGADVNREDYPEKGMTPFLIVAVDGNWDMLSLLIKHGANKTSVDDHGRNVVRIAAESKNVAILKELLKDPVFRDQNCVDGDGVTPFQAAARVGDEETLKLLFKYYPQDLNRAKKVGRSVPPLISAVEYRHAEATRFLLLCPGIEIDVTDKAGNTALLAAAAQGDTWDANPQMLDTIRKAGANVRQQNSQGYNALAKAVTSKSPKTVSYLLAWDDIDVNVKTAAGSPLCIAAQKGRKDMVQILLGKKPDLDIRDNEGKTALALAAGGPTADDKWHSRRQESEQTYKIVCRKLLKAGIPIDDTDLKGRTPLIHAAKEGHALVVEFLLEEGADIDAEDEDGETAADYAKGKKHTDVVQALEGHAKESWICSRCKSEEKR